MDNDDLPVGRILSRREALFLFGGAGLAFLTGCGGSNGGPTASATPTPGGPGATATPRATSTPGAAATPVASNSCIVRPELTQGPFFVDEKLLRSDIRSDPSTGAVQAGARLSLSFNVSQLSGGACGALAGAAIDLWHANARGLYSDVASEGTQGQKFLRGYQTTDASGSARFTTVFPGWYSGRAVHIHMMLRATIAGRSYQFTSQLFFNDAVSDQVFALAPYNTRGARDTRNSNDNIFSQGGSQMILALSGSPSAGYSAAFNLALAT